ASRVNFASKRDAALPRKADRLLAKLSRLAGGRSFEPGFAWAGTFAETTDGLPYIGALSDGDPRVHFAMAYGGNGITYSVIAADILREAIHGRTHPRAAMFGFGRIGR
ncbi:MAG TPA: FAD-dependent oxidoreductase, partial [Pinirhizobacter sp.]|uniref:FAD-dependent oxidoreductase n=1 Tax=Pinirhizobacter sp. TaxID=2950432 RepID=UPI002B7B7CA1